MKKILFLALFAFLLVSCSENAFLDYGEAYVAECEHGSLSVEQKVMKKYQDTLYYYYVVIANPDEGYCLKPENLFVNHLNKDYLGSSLEVYENSENYFSFSTGISDDIFISAYFTKKGSN